MDEASLQELGEYVEVMSASARSTSRAEDRATYQLHLAEAAELIPPLLASDTSAIAAWVEGASRTYGIGYLSGPEGDRAERAFVELREQLGA